MSVQLAALYFAERVTGSLTRSLRVSYYVYRKKKEQERREKERKRHKKRERERRKKKRATLRFRKARANAPSRRGKRKARVSRTRHCNFFLFFFLKDVSQSLRKKRNLFTGVRMSHGDLEISTKDDADDRRRLAVHLKSA